MILLQLLKIKVSLTKGLKIILPGLALPKSTRKIRESTRKQCLSVCNCGEKINLYKAMAVPTKDKQKFSNPVFTFEGKERQNPEKNLRTSKEKFPLPFICFCLFLPLPVSGPKVHFSEKPGLYWEQCSDPTFF